MKTTKSSSALAICASVLLVICLATSVTQATTLEWWQFWTDPTIKPTIDSIVAEFEAKNPTIDVQLSDLTWANGQEKIAIAFASGSGPDIVEIGSDWVAQFASAGQLADLSAMVTPDSTDFVGWQLTTYQQKVYGFPWILGTRILYGNRDLMTKAHYDTNFVPVFLGQLVAACKLIHTNEPNAYGWGSNTPEKHRLYKKFLSLFWAIGGKIFSDDGRYCLLASDYGIEALRGYKEMHDSGGFVGDQRAIEDAFIAGKVGYITSGDWFLKRLIQEKPKFNYFTTMMPGKRYPGKSFLGGEILSINASSSQKKEAYEFIKFLTSPENQLRFCKSAFSMGPSNKKVQADPYFASNPNFLTFMRQMRACQAPPVDPKWVEYEAIIEKAVEDCVFNGVGPATALLTAQRAITKIRKQ